MTLFDRAVATLLILLFSLFAAREVNGYLERSLIRPNIVVSVTGAVLRPGVIGLPSDARMIHAIDRCGGLTSEADVAALELARPITDGEHVSVPEVTTRSQNVSDQASVDESPFSESNSRSAPPVSKKPSLKVEPPEGTFVNSHQRYRPVKRPTLNPLPKQGGSRSRTSRIEAPSEALPQGKVDINRATLDDLIAIPGVGPVMARRILEARQASNGGTFGSLEELAAIRGIKEKTLSRLRPYLKIEGL